MTAATAAPQQEPAEDGDIFQRRDEPLAVRAARARADDGVMPRQAGDTDVEEAAEGQTHQHDKDRNQHGHRPQYRTLPVRGFGGRTKSGLQ